MSGLAKAFVVINLILALFFLGASATLFQVQEGWKDTAEQLGTKVTQMEGQYAEVIQTKDGEISSARTNNQTLSTENEVLRSQNQDLTNANGGLKNQVAQLESRNSVLETNIAQKDAHLQDKDNVLAQKEQTITELTRELQEKDESAKDAIAFANRAELDRQQIEEELSQVSEQLAMAERDRTDKALMLSAVEQAGFNLSTLGVQVVPKIDAVVVAVSGDGIVVLSVGRDDGVQPGYEFTVYRGDQFIGKVKVESVLGDMSGARVLFTEPSETIRAGDKSSTRLIG
jgi:cell division protein FtsL